MPVRSKVKTPSSKVMKCLKEDDSSRMLTHPKECSLCEVNENPQSEKFLSMEKNRKEIVSFCTRNGATSPVKEKLVEIGLIDFQLLFDETNEADFQECDINYECPSTLMCVMDSCNKSENIEVDTFMQDLFYSEQQESEWTESILLENLKSDDNVPLTQNLEPASVELSPKRSIKSLTMTPGHVKRKLTKLLNSFLICLELDTPIQDLTKQKLINDFKSMKFQTVESLSNLCMRIEKICVHDQNSRRNAKRRLKRKKTKIFSIPN